MKDYLLFKIDLLDRALYIKELKVRHYKIILKCLIGDDIDAEYLFKNINEILLDLTDLSIKEINELSLLDYFLILFELRSNSVGSIIFAETSDEVTTKLEININRFIELLKQVKVNNLFEVENIDNFCVEYRLPTITEIINIDPSNLETIYGIFVKSIQYNNTTINLYNLEPDKLKLFLEKIPAKLTSHLIKKSYEILSDPKFHQVIFNFHSFKIFSGNLPIIYI
jgi:hypothetical protein